MKLDNVTILGVDCLDPERLRDAMDICEEEIEFAESLILTSKYLDDSRKVEISKISTIEEYSKFCVKDIKNYVSTDYVLIIQWDGFILNPSSWSSEFLKYDYIGAPWVVSNWAVDKFYFPKKFLNKTMVGNGGFSLRSKKFIESSARLYKEKVIYQFHPEDIAMSIWYREYFIKNKINFAPPEIAHKFSIENTKDYNLVDQFGFHGFQSVDLGTWFENNQKYKNVKKNYLMSKNSKKNINWTPPINPYKKNL